MVARWRRSAALSVLLGIVLIALSLPRVGIETYLLQTHETLDNLETGKAVENNSAFADKLGALAAAQESPQIDGLAARAWIALARKPGRAAEDRHADLIRAQEVQAAGLARAPADQYGWQRLSFTLAERNEWIASAKAWQLGLVTGPFEPTIMPVKFESGLALWRFMDLPQRGAFTDLTANFAQTQPALLAALTRQYGAEAIVRQALGGRPELEIFEKNLAWRQPK